MGRDAGGKLGVAGDGELPFRRSRLEPPMWLEWFDPGMLPVLAGWGRLPRGRRKRWSSSSLPPNKARLSEGGGSMVLSPVSFLPVPVPRLVVISHWQLGKTALFLFRVDIFPSAGASSRADPPQVSVCASDVRVSPLPTDVTSVALTDCERNLCISHTQNWAQSTVPISIRSLTCLHYYNKKGIIHDAWIKSPNLWRDKKIFVAT